MQYPLITKACVISTGTDCLPSSCPTANSVRKSICSFTNMSCNFCGSPESLSPGSIDNSFNMDTIGPGIPIPAPAVFWEPDISLAK